MKIPDYYFEQGQSGGNGYPFPGLNMGRLKSFIIMKILIWALG